MKILKKFLKILFIFSCLFPIFNISINYYLINQHSNFIKNHIETIDENLTLKNMSWTTSFLMPTFFLLDKQINKFKNLFVMYDVLPYIFSFDKFSKFKIYAFEENVDKTILDISADLFLDQTIKMKKGLFSFEGSEFFIEGRFCHQNNLNLNYEIIPDCQNATFNQSVFDINKIFNNFIGLFTVENITKNNHFVIENLLFSEKQNKNNKITIDKIILKKINEEDFVFSGGIKKTF